MRIVSQPAFSGKAIGVQDVAELLMRNMAHPHHRSLPLDFGIEQVIGSCTGGLLGHRQVTDAWLLTLAIRNDMKLLTFDTGISRLVSTVAERARYLHTPA